MTHKTEQLYVAVLSELCAYIPGFKPLFAICDFEKASRNSFATNFPEIIITYMVLVSLYRSYLRQSEKVRSCKTL